MAGSPFEDWANRLVREAYQGYSHTLAPHVLFAHTVKLAAEMERGAVNASAWLVQEGGEEPRPYVTQIVRMAVQLHAAPGGAQFYRRKFLVLTQFPLDKTHQAKGMRIGARNAMEGSGGVLSPRQQPLPSSADNASGRPANEANRAQAELAVNGPLPAGTAWEAWADRVLPDARGQLHAMIPPDLLLAHAVNASEWLVQEEGEALQPYVAQVGKLAEQLRAAPAGAHLAPRQFPVLTQFPFHETRRAKGMRIELRNGLEEAGGELPPRQEPLPSSADNASDRPATNPTNHNPSHLSSSGPPWPNGGRTHLFNLENARKEGTWRRAGHASARTHRPGGGSAAGTCAWSCGSWG